MVQGIDSQQKMGERIGSIDVLRLFFAVIIVLHHSRYVLGDENCIFLGGSLAVEFFFYVSGYFLFLSVQKRELQDEKEGKREGIGTQTFHFILHKIKSFLPEFLISWIIGFVLIAWLGHWTLSDIFRAFVENFWELTLVRMSGLYTGGINGVVWYLSAMLLAMAILYPLMRKNLDFMSHVGCPLISLFIYGYLMQTYGHPRDPSVWTGFAFKGLLRAIADLCVGVVAAMAAGKIRKNLNGPGNKKELGPKTGGKAQITLLGSCFVTAIEGICLFLCVRYMALQTPGKTDYFYMFLLMILVILCCCGLGIENCLPSEKPGFQKFLRFCSNYSLTLYLSHFYFAAHMNDVLDPSRFSGMERMGVYCILAFFNAFVVMGLSTLCRRKGKGVFLWLKRKLIRENETR